MSSMVSALASVQMAQIAQTYSWLRAMSGGKLTQEQVTAGDEIIEKAGLETLPNSLVTNLNLALQGNGIFPKKDMNLFVDLKVSGIRHIWIQAVYRLSGSEQSNIQMARLSEWVIPAHVLKQKNGSKRL